MSKVVYENPLAYESDIRDFILEGKANISFDEGAMRIDSKNLSPEDQKDGCVLWCPVSFPSDVKIEWVFRPLEEPGLAMLFFAAKPIESGKDFFGSDMAERTGKYRQYYNGDINAYHISYFRRKEETERAFHLCNLRKSCGCNLVAQGADPIPDANPDSGWYEMRIIKNKDVITFLINDIVILEYEDDGRTYGDYLTGGYVGFRQLSPMIAEYRDFRVTWL
ncbi:DUF1961 family protein [Butyrivibrio sp. CB08]|uniref:DUF1961 family protein n=1 Tax=Butyrivibrio sp. CB08 TaxID=2364879 RepID=UPI000EAA3D1E|nr:DUF1961 family protein [Butyrivibrio sp. CB08]RKM61993.1 DUF1961 family protein [Butyrivibrio sp. CB08]